MKLRANPRGRGANYYLRYDDDTHSGWIDYVCHGELQNHIEEGLNPVELLEDVRLIKKICPEGYEDWLHHLLNNFRLSYLTDTKDVQKALEEGVKVDLTRGSLRHVKAFLMYLRAGKEIEAHKGYKRLLEGGVEEHLSFVLSRAVDELDWQEWGWGAYHSDHCPLTGEDSVKDIHKWSMGSKETDGGDDIASLVGEDWTTLYESSKCKGVLIPCTEKGVLLDEVFSGTGGGFGSSKSPTIEQIIERIKKEQLCVAS